jgi:peptidoglycan/xylan/chitin deacetylase (PgdA/CDA1 family)
LATILVGYDTEAGAIGEGLARLGIADVPQYRVAFEDGCTARALEVMTAVHADVGVPGTLFICGKTLLESLDAVREAHATGLFDVQQHTYSHYPFRDVVYSPDGAPALGVPTPPAVALREEVEITSRLIHKHLRTECVGIRTPFGYYRGLRGLPDRLRLLHDAGIRYVTSWGRDEHDRCPTPWVQPFTYADEGFPDILELPFQFWLDAIWFDRHGYENGAGFRAALCGAVDEIADTELVYGACFHEWTVLAADEARTGWIRGFLEHARARGVEVTTYTDYWRRASGAAAKEDETWMSTPS